MLRRKLPTMLAKHYNGWRLTRRLLGRVGTLVIHRRGIVKINLVDITVPKPPNKQRQTFYTP